MPSDAQPKFLTNTFVHLFNEMADRPERKWLVQEIGVQQYLREFNTMMLHMPRHCGKTTALMQIFKERGDAAMLVFARHSLLNCAAHNAGIDRRKFWTADNFKFMRGKTIHQRYFLFDEWQYIQKSTMDEIYQMINMCRPFDAPLPIFFGLGTR